MPARLKIIGVAPRTRRACTEAEAPELPHALERRLAELVELAGVTLYETQRQTLLDLCGTPGVQRVDPLRVELVTDSVQLTVRVVRNIRPCTLVISPSGRSHRAD
jgi:hypothetical protein